MTMMTIQEQYEQLERTVLSYNPGADIPKIREAFANELKDTTKIIIAQRVASVRDADLILVMDGGRVVAQGSHEELMQTCSIYREVYESQQEGGESHE